MNGLSWLLYAAETISNLRGAALVALSAGAFVGFIASAFAHIEMDVATRDIARVWKRAIPAICVAAAVLVLTPSKETLMLIAASELGETILASKEVQTIGGEAGALASDSLKLIRKYVTEQLGETEAE